jgi:hypothetical protein
MTIVCQIYKNKEKSKDPTKYRGISLLLMLGKIFYSILAGSLSNWLINHKILSKFQAVFFKGKRAINNIFVIKL